MSFFGFLFFLRFPSIIIVLFFSLPFIFSTFIGGLFRPYFIESLLKFLSLLCSSLPFLLQDMNLTLKLFYLFVICFLFSFLIEQNDILIKFCDLFFSSVQIFFYLFFLGRNPLFFFFFSLLLFIPELFFEILYLIRDILPLFLIIYIIPLFICDLSFEALDNSVHRPFSKSIRAIE